MSLSDHIDLLNRNTKKIKAIAQSSPTKTPFAAPFAHAILQSHLGDLIRDADPSELGLFSLVQPEEASVHEKLVEIERVNFNGATPLKRPNTRRDDTSHLRDDPDVYAGAALKYMDRYKLVRPMPRARVEVQAILERIPILRRNIEDLTDALHQLEQTRAPMGFDYKRKLEEEERRIRELRTKLTQLTNKRLALTKAKKSHLDLTESKNTTPRPFVSAKTNPEEHEFWNTPGASTRTFKFSGDNLLTEQGVDFTDISTISFSASPTLPKAAPNIFTENALSLSVENPGRQSFQASGISQDKDLPSRSSRVQSAESSCGPTQDVPIQNNVNISLPVRNPEQLDSSKTGNVVLENAPSITITQEVETITVKIWSVMSDLIIAAAGTNVGLNSKPSTREIINYLETMQKSTPSDGLSITANDGPSLQQVLTASLLVGLLASPVRYSLPLSRVKVLLAAQTHGANPSHSNTSRIVYGCVAKRLLKIDRTGGEQIVAFDV